MPTSRTFAHVASILLAVSCREPAAPPGPPYLAVMSRFVVGPGVHAPSRIRFSINEASGTLNVNRFATAIPGDTLIFPFPPASYLVELLDVPPTCTVLNGRQRFITLLETDNTGLVRYNVSCIPSLIVDVRMDGFDLDTQLAYRLEGPGGERVGYIDLTGPDTMNTRSDSIVFENLPAGAYELSLSHMASNCLLLGSATMHHVVSVPSSGGASTTFRVRCSEEANRPRVVSFKSSYADGGAAFVAQTFDPDRDLKAYTWDLTNCQGTSALPGGPRTRRGVDLGRGYRADSLTILAAFEVPTIDSLVRALCISLVLEDGRGNSTRVEQRLGARTGSAPVATDFNARNIGTSSLTTSLTVSDPDDDVAGVFVMLKLRDGVLAPFDGNADIGILTPIGYEGTVVPNIPYTGSLHWDDVHAVIVYVIDFAGNFRRLEDRNLLQ